MNLIKTTLKELKYFLILWSTQALSQLGSSMTNYALIIWSYTAKGSALTTALLSVCSYAPYVIMSIFAGSLSDKWNKKITMLVSDTCAALCTISIFILLKTGRLEIWHLYCLNALNGLMNTVPAACIRCCNHTFNTKKALSEGQRTAFIFKCTDKYSDTDNCNCCIVFFKSANNYIY